MNGDKISTRIGGHWQLSEATTSLRLMNTKCAECIFGILTFAWALGVPLGVVTGKLGIAPYIYHLPPPLPFWVLMTCLLGLFQVGSALMGSHKERAFGAWVSTFFWGMLVSAAIQAHYFGSGLTVMMSIAFLQITLALHNSGQSRDQTLP